MQAMVSKHGMGFKAGWWRMSPSPMWRSACLVHGYPHPVVAAQGFKCVHRGLQAMVCTHGMGFKAEW